MLTLKWVLSDSGSWLPFETFNLSNVTDSGVYVIWHAGQPARTVKVGQGNIKSRLQAHRIDSPITRYRNFGPLYVTWASVPALQRDGVERYLGNLLNPLIADRFPDVLPVAVNSPF
jgi:hypothetical protein